MTKFLLIVHVLAAIIAIGPVTVAASAFPAAVRRAAAEPGSDQALGAVRNLHRICRVYALVGVVVPVFGLATANSLHVLGDAWLIVSIVLTVLAAGGPRAAGAAGAERGPGESRAGASARLAMSTGVFNLLWATVTVLMIVRPGSTTGA